MANKAARIILVSTVRDAKSKILGYNFINYLDGKVEKLSITADKLAMIKNYKIENAEVVANSKGALTLKGTNGVIDRYPVFMNAPAGLTQVSHSLVVVSRLADGFVLADGSGNIARLSTDDAVGYFKLQGIANGKLVTVDSGKETVSSIKGNYVEEEGRVNPVATKEKEKVAKNKYSDNFYRMIEKAFGKAKAAIIKYLIEIRGKGSPEVFSSVLKAFPKRGIAVVGLMVISDDVRGNAKDDKLIKLMSTIVEDKAIKLVVEQANKGIDFDSIWDCDKTFGYEENEALERKYDITGARIQNYIENYEKNNK